MLCRLRIKMLKVRRCQKIFVSLQSVFYFGTMKDYVEKNDCIIDEWKKWYVMNNQSKYPGCSNLHEYFSPDGIMYKGDFKQCFKTYPEGGTFFRWERVASGEENALWSDAPLRILYLTKDQNTSGDIAWDVRSESFRYRNSNYRPEELYLDTGVAFYRNLVYSLYGIMNSTKEEVVNYSFKNEKALEFADKQIFARINCKKEVGESVCGYKKLFESIYDNDGNVNKFLKRQIVNLDADVFVCCGLMDFMPEFLNKVGYEFTSQDKDKWIFYDSKKNKVAINSYHLSYSGFNLKNMISAYNAFLKDHPHFVDSHRN